MLTLPRTAAALAFALAFACTAQAQSPAAPGMDWSVTCAETACQAGRSVSDVKTGNRIASIIFSLGKDGTDEIVVITPLGIVLEAGLKIRHGGKDLDLPFEVCFPDGCRARRFIEDAEEAALTAASSLDILAFAYGQDKAVRIPVPTSGLEKALKEAHRRAAALP